MRIFADTADVAYIRKLASMGAIDGVTTNPSLLAKEGRDPSKVMKDILKAVEGPVSLEVTASDTKGMVAEAERLAALGKNAVIKIPMTPEGMLAVKELSGKGIRTNVTLVFSLAQAILAAKAGATYVSPFVGRLDDAGQDGMQLVEEILTAFDNYGFGTEVIVASIRGMQHVKEAALLGADVATIPPAIIEQMFRHPLTEVGIKKFLDDWNKLKSKK